MAGIGSGRISAPGSADTGSLVDVIVDPDGSGDYTTISDACTAEAIDTIIGVRSGAITEIADIIMKLGQIVVALAGDGSGDQVTVDMGNDYQWILAGSNKVSGLKVISTNNTVTPLFDLNGTYCTLDTIYIDATGYQTTSEFINSDSDHTIIRNIQVDSNPAQACSGIVIPGQDYTIAENVYIEDLRGAGGEVAFRCDGNGVYCSNIRIEYASGVAHGNGNGFIVNGNYYRSHYENIIIDGDPTGALATAFTIGAVKDCIFDGLACGGFALGMQITSVSVCKFSNINIGFFSNLEYVVDGIRFTGGGAFAPSTGNEFVNVNATAQGNLATGFGLYITGSNAEWNNFTNCFFAGDNGSGVRTDPNTNRFNKFTNCSFTGTANALYHEADLNTFTNCYFGALQVTLTASPASGNRFDNCQWLESGSIINLGIWNIFNGRYDPVVPIAPTVNEGYARGFLVGDRWAFGGLEYICQDNTFGAASWVIAGVTSSDEIWDVLVDPVVGVGDYTTVGAALAGASDGAIIGVSPGVYDESGDDWTFQDGQTVFALGGIDEGSTQPSVVCNMGDSVITMNTDTQLKGVFCNFVATTDEAKIATADDCVIDQCTFDYRGTGGAQDVSGISCSGARVRISNIRIYGSTLTDNHIRLSGSYNNIVNVEITGGQTPYVSVGSGERHSLFDQIYVHDIASWAGTGVDCNGTYVRFSNWKIIDDGAGHSGTGIDIPNDGYTFLDNIYVEGIDTGIDVVGDQNQLSNIYCNDCNTGITMPSGNENVFVNCTMRDCVNIGFDISGNDSMFTNCTSDGVPTTDFDLDDILRNIFVNCNAPSANVDVGGTSEDNRFIGCQFSALTLQAGAARTVIDNCLITTLTDGGTFTKRGVEVHISASDPTVNDDINDGFVAGLSLWYNTANDTMWKCDDNTATAAVWTNIGGSGYTQEEKTQADSPVTVEAFKEYNNTGAVGACTFNLPDASTLYQSTPESNVRFIVVVAQNMVIQAAAGDTIHSNGVSSSAGGTATSSTQYSTIELVPVGSNDWIAVAQTGTWAFA